MTTEFKTPTARQWSKADANSPGWITAQAGHTPLFEGVPGVGKSSSILAMALLLKREALLLIGSTHAPEDFSGIPFVSTCKTYFSQVPAEWAARLSKPGAMLFIDELTTVPPSVRAAMLSMLTERRLGSLAIHPDTIILSACNPPRYAPNASPLEKSMANRFAHYQWVHDFETWTTGMESEVDCYEQAWFPVVDPNWQRFRVKWGHMITGYLRKNSNERVLIPDNDEELSFPTPRTWTYLRNCLAAAESVAAPPNIQSKIAAGCVGKTVGSNFLRYVAQLDLIDPEACLAGTAKFEFDRKRVDLASALLVSLVSCIKQNYTEERLDAAIDIFCNNVGKHAKDLVFTQLRHLVKARPEGKPLSKKSIEAITEFGRNIPDAVRNRGKA